jgi:hypothetical protein
MSPLPPRTLPTLKDSWFWISQYPRAPINPPTSAAATIS